MKLFHVTGWNDHYENNRSRKVENLQWVPIPNHHDGERYSMIWTEDDGAELFAAWILILQVASKCHPRGTLVRSDGKAHDAKSLSMKTRALPRIFVRALDYFSKTGWLTLELSEQQELPLERHPPAIQVPPECHSSGTQVTKKGMEGNGREWKGTILPAEPAAKKRNPLIDALAVVDGIPVDEIGPTSGKRLGQALKVIRESSPKVTAQEIQARAANYRTHFPDVALTAMALSRHWGRCAQANSSGITPKHDDSEYQLAKKVFNYEL